MIDDTGLALNNLARKQMVRRLLADILIDINVCKLEGWDYMKFINEIKTEIDRLVK